jgi:Protein of unknown function (DUF2752)
VNVVEFTHVQGRNVRIVAVGLVAVAAVWPILPAHPPLACPLRSATGIPCPFCGMTRAVVAAAHGDVVGSLRFNPAGILVLALAAYVIFRPRLPRVRAPVWILFAVGAVLWAYNIALNPTF